MDPFNNKNIWEPFRKDRRQFKEIFSHQDGYKELIESTERMAYLIRSYSVYSMTCASLGHPGGTFSEAEVLSVIYNYVLRFDSFTPSWPQRDLFYLSKCHACPGLYAALALSG
jgi:transketolase